MIFQRACLFASPCGLGVVGNPNRSTAISGQSMSTAPLFPDSATMELCLMFERVVLMEDRVPPEPPGPEPLPTNVPPESGLLTPMEMLWCLMFERVVLMEDRVPPEPPGPEPLSTKV